MKDILDFESPFWVFGILANTLFLKSYMTKLLVERNQVIKNVAESDEWRKYLIPDPEPTQ